MRGEKSWAINMYCSTIAVNEAECTKKFLDMYGAFGTVKMIACL
jgi:hypothetical protein